MARRDVLTILALAVIVPAGLGIFLHFYTEAFPAASLDFRLSREDAYRAARDYLTGQGYDVEDYESAQVFGWDQMPQVFLERTIGLEETNRLAREWLSIWSWRVRWYRPLQKEEFRVRLDPGGRVVAFRHMVPEAEPGAAIDQEAARAIAAAFLADEQGFDLGQYDLVDRSTTERKARVDHEFSWRKRAFTVGEDGHYRLEVLVHGDRVGSFREYLKVPESFSRSYTEVRSRANLLTGIFQLFWVALAVAAIVVLLRYYRRGLLEWQPGLVVGALVALASVVGTLNALPLIRYSFDTTQPHGVFLIITSLGAVLVSALLGAVICAVGTAGNALGRQALYGGHQSPLGRLSLRGVLSRGFLRSTAVGYAIAGGMLAYVTLFYLVGSRYFGLWVPADVSDYSNAFSTALPWIYPLLAGLSASALEEFFFRLLAISLLIRWLKRRWLAVLIPAVVWAFLHSNYPVEPIYTRGIELTAVGIVFGFAFLRYGIWAPIVAHYAYNAFLTAFPMIKSSSLYFQVSGLAVTVILLLPAVPALVAVLLGKDTEESGDGTTEGVAGQPVPEPQAHPQPLPVAEPAPPDDVPEPPPCVGPEAYTPGRREWVAAGAFAVVGLLLALGFKTDRLGSRTLTMAVTRGQAVRTAEAFCADVGIDIEGYRRTVQYRSHVGSDHFVHLARTAGVARADSLMYENTCPWVWYVRWFRPLEKEEVQVGVDASGRGVLFLDHQIPETRPGQDLTADSARAQAVGFLRDRFGRNVADRAVYKPLESRSEKKEARLDHHFLWERIDRKVDDGEFRIEVRVQGDRVGNAVMHYKAPEAFLRDLKRQGMKDVIVMIGATLLALATLVLAGVYLFRAYGEDRLQWRFPLSVGVLMAGATLVQRLNRFPAFFQTYDTSQALGTFLGMRAVGLLIGTAFTGVLFAVAFALLLSLYRSACRSKMPPDRWIGLLSLREGSVRFWSGTVLFALAFALYRFGTDQLRLYFRYHEFTEHLKPGDYAMPGVNDLLISVGALAEGLSSFLAPMLLLLGLLIWRRVIGKTWILPVLVLLAYPVFLALARGGSAPHVAFLLGVELLTFAPFAVLIVAVIRFNLLAYAIAFWSAALVFGPGLGFLNHATPAVYRIEGAVVLVLGLLPLLLPLAAHLRQRRNPGQRVEVHAE